jgi:hypothetical protein
MTVQELKNQIREEFAAWEDELMRKVPFVFLFLVFLRRGAPERVFI